MSHEKTHSRRASPSATGRPSPTTALLQRVADLLADGLVQDALGLLRGSVADDPYVQNARGVCLMRAGRYREAVVLYRKLALHDNDLNLDLAQPPTFIVNYATALLLERNVQGCMQALSDLRQEEHPGVVRLRDVVERWRRGLRWWPRLMFSVYGDVRQPIVLDFPPGELLIPEARQPAHTA